MQRGVARLSMLHGLRHCEVARRLSLREGTVRSHLTIARKRLLGSAQQNGVPQIGGDRYPRRMSTRSTM